MNYINKDGGIQRHRWGDSTIQANAVKMFCDKSQIQKFDFAYEHRSHGYKNYDEVSDSKGMKVKKLKHEKTNSKYLTGAASYHTLLAKYNTSNFDYIIEVVVDCADAIKLNYATNKKVYAFECNPTCVEICKKFRF